MDLLAKAENFVFKYCPAKDIFSLKEFLKKIFNPVSKPLLDDDTVVNVDPVELPVEPVVNVDPVEPPVEPVVNVDLVEPPVESVVIVDSVEPPVEPVVNVDPFEPPV